MCFARPCGRLRLPAAHCCCLWVTFASVSVSGRFLNRWWWRHYQTRTSLGRCFSGVSGVSSLALPAFFTAMLQSHHIPCPCERRMEPCVVGVVPLTKHEAGVWTSTYCFQMAASLVPDLLALLQLHGRACVLLSEAHLLAQHVFLAGSAS